MHGDGISNADFARPHDLGQDALAIVQHQLAQTAADRIHFSARIARGIEQQHGFADFNFAADEVDEVYSKRLDVRAYRTRWNGLKSERRRVFGNLFAFDQGDLPPAGLAVIAAFAPEVARFAEDTFCLDDFDRLDSSQGRPRLGRMQMQRGHTAQRGRGDRGIHLMADYENVAGEMQAPPTRGLDRCVERRQFEKA
jgi:hypothetical protein